MITTRAPDGANKQYLQNGIDTNNVSTDSKNIKINTKAMAPQRRESSMDPAGRRTTSGYKNEFRICVFASAQTLHLKKIWTNFDNIFNGSL